MSKENIIQNISQIYTDYEVGEAWGINKSENWSKINQNIDVMQIYNCLGQLKQL